MRKLSYRNKLRLKKIIKISLVVLLLLILLGSVYLLYLQRHVVYHRDGVTLDFDATTEDIPLTDADAAQTGRPALPRVEILYVEEGDTTGALSQITGYYVDARMLVEHTDAVNQALQALTEPCWIMLDMKNPAGKFYYSTQISGAQTAEIDTQAVDALLSDLKKRGFKLIARIPAFADSAFALEHIDAALPMKNEILWTDSDGGYWLDPANTLVQDYLQQICKELSSLGFTEVVFEDFYFPTSGNIAYESTQTKAEIIAAAARNIDNAFTSSNLVISFCTDESTFSLDSITGRLYFTSTTGGNLETVVGAAQGIVANPASQLVFLSDSHDTRFDAHGHLFPLLDVEKLEAEAQQASSAPANEADDPPAQTEE